MTVDGSRNPNSGEQTAPVHASTVSDLLIGATILVVDDEAPNRKLLERMVGGRGGADVHLLADPRDTVSTCHQISPDLVMLDLHMPHMDGVEVIAAIRNEFSGSGFFPIIVLTADVTSGAKEAALAAGANDFLTKPFDFTEVLLRVSNLLKTRTDFTEIETLNRSIQLRLDDRDAQNREADEARRASIDRIKQALEPGALRMVFQPIFNISEMQVVGYEALARFNVEPQRSPDKWFQEAAEVGDGGALEITAVTAALNQFPSISARQFLTVNVSPATLMGPRFEDALAGLPFDRIILELTEHVVFTDYPDLVATLGKLRSEGIRIAIDDAGSGYSGLQHLLLVRPDIIKLDIDLVKGIDHDPPRRALVAGLLNFAAEINATTIAEGIETAEELAALGSLGVPWGQGYHLARPGPLPDPATWQS